MTARLYIPARTPDAAYALASLSWRMLQGVVALACCGLFGAGVACLALVLTR